MTLEWQQFSGLYPWRARVEGGAYEVATYIGSHGPRYLAWFKTGGDVTPVSDMSGDVEYVKGAAERHYGAMQRKAAA